MLNPTLSITNITHCLRTRQKLKCGRVDKKKRKKKFPFLRGKQFNNFPWLRGCTHFSQKCDFNDLAGFHNVKFISRNFNTYFYYTHGKERERDIYSSSIAMKFFFSQNYNNNNKLR